MNNDLLNLLRPELTEQEVRKLCKTKKDELGFDIEKALFPTNPFISNPEPTMALGDAICLLEEWVNTCDIIEANYKEKINGAPCVWNCVVDTIRPIVGNEVIISIVDNIILSLESFISTKNSGTKDAIQAYISTIFYDVEKWNFIDHEPGVNPFQPVIDLWEAGYIPAHRGISGSNWFLYAGIKTKHGNFYADIVWHGIFESV